MFSSGEVISTRLDPIFNLQSIHDTVAHSREIARDQGGITCGAINEPRKSSKVIDEHVIINFCDKNVVIARFCDKHEVFVLFIDIYI